MDRDARGRFLPGNSLARIGGQARARALCPHCRWRISRAGWRGLVEKRFHGDVDRARQWLGKLGASCFRCRIQGDRAWGLESTPG